MSMESKLSFVSNDPRQAMPPLWEHQRQTKDHHRKMFDNGLPSFDLSDCGTGKTRSTLDFLCDLKMEGKLPPVLMFGPLSILAPAWGDDCAKWTPQLTTQLCYAAKRRESLLKKADIHLLNHDAITFLSDSANSDIVERFSGAIIVIDEFTAYKTYNAQRSKNMHYLAQLHKCKPSMVIQMSGTPKTKTVCDMWMPGMIADNGERLGNKFFAFRFHMCQGEQVGPTAQMMKWSDKQGSQEMVFDLLSDISIRHQEKDCQDLPENRQWMKQVELPKAVMKAYKEMESTDLMFAEDGSPVSAVHAGAKLTKLLQLCSGAVYDEQGEVIKFHKERYELVIQLVREVPHSIVAFNWSHEKEALRREALKHKLNFAFIDGSVTVEERTEIVRMYQEGMFDVVFCHPVAAGHGLTFTKASRTIWCSPTFRTEAFLQFNKRVHRGGQQKETDTIFISAKGTKEELVYEVLQNETAGLNDLLALFSADTKNRNKL